MKQYLLQRLPPGGCWLGARGHRADHERDVDEVNTEMQAAGAWGLRRRAVPVEHGHRGPAVRRGRADHRRPVRRGQGAHRRRVDHQGAGPGRRAGVGSQGDPRLPDPGRGAAVPGRGRGLTTPGQVASRSFRAEYGRAVAVLTRVLGDIDLAEDAAQEAFKTSTLFLRRDAPIYDIRVTIEEGEFYHVGLIKVFGNTRTEASVILHETLLFPGELFDNRKLKGTEYRLLNTRLFASVNVYAVQSQFERGDDGLAYKDIYIESRRDRHRKCRPLLWI